MSTRKPFNIYGSDDTDSITSKLFDELIRPDLNDEQFAEHVKDMRSKRLLAEMKEANSKSPPGIGYTWFFDENGHPTCANGNCGRCAMCYDKGDIPSHIIAGVNLDYQSNPLAGLARGAVPVLPPRVSSGISYRDRVRDLALRNEFPHPPIHIPKLEDMEYIPQFSSSKTGISPFIPSGGFKRGETFSFNSLNVGTIGHGSKKTNLVTDVIRRSAKKAIRIAVSFEHPSYLEAWDHEVDVLVNKHFPIQVTRKYKEGGYVMKSNVDFDQPHISYRHGKIMVGGKSIYEIYRTQVRGDYDSLIYGNLAYRRVHTFGSGGQYPFDYPETRYYDLTATEIDSLTVMPSDYRHYFGKVAREPWAEEAIDKLIWLDLYRGKEHIQERSAGGYLYVSSNNVPRATFRTKQVKEAARERIRKVTQLEGRKRGSSLSHPRSR